MNPTEMNQQEMRAQLRLLRAEIEKLKATAAGRRADSRSKFDRYLEVLDDKSNDVGERLKSLKDAGDDAMGDITKGLKDAMGRLEIAKRAAKARFH